LKLGFNTNCIEKRRMQNCYGGHFRHILLYRKITSTVASKEKAREIMRQCMYSSVLKLLEIDVKTVILLQHFPEPDYHMPNQLEKSLKLGLDLTLLHINQTQHYTKMADVREVTKNITDECKQCLLIDPENAFCEFNLCQTYFIQDKIIHSYYHDDNHLNDYGTEKLFELLNHSQNLHHIGIGNFNGNITGYNSSQITIL
jgi:hypothetical protein